MTETSAPAAVRTATIEKPSFVEWPAVFSGAVLAAALSFVFLTFGTAIGLSATSPWPGSGLSAKVVASIAIFWVMAQQIGSLMIGGYVAGRLHTRWHETGHEADFRDGLHGGLVWAVGVVISALLVFTAAGAAARTGVEVAGKAAATTDPMDAVIDTMLRPTTTAQAATPPAPAVPGAPVQPRRGVPPSDADTTRSEIGRIIGSSVASGGLSAENRTYLAQVVAHRAGIPQPEAERRADAAIIQAREVADKARKAAILTGFVTAAGLILSLGAAWWAAMQGGQHRDNSVPARFDFTSRRRSVP